MKKTITICDKCKREIHKGEQFVERCIKHPDSCEVRNMQDICRDCVYSTIGNKTYTANTGNEYKPVFFKAANRESWNIL